jgi:hypothetical protein
MSADLQTIIAQLAATLVAGDRSDDTPVSRTTDYYTGRALDLYVTAGVTLTRERDRILLGDADADRWRKRREGQIAFSLAKVRQFLHDRRRNDFDSLATEAEVNLDLMVDLLRGGDAP